MVCFSENSFMNSNPSGTAEGGSRKPTSNAPPLMPSTWRLGDRMDSWSSISG